MPRTGEKVKRLIEQDEEMEDAIKTVLKRVDDNDGGVTWEDVEGDITSGRWGRLIEKDIIVPADGDEFELVDRDAVEDALGADLDIELELPEVDADVSWSRYDKLAGLATVGLMVGYWLDPLQDRIGGVVDIFFGPLESVLPFYGVILAAAIFTGLYSSLLQANLMDMGVMGQYQERMQVMQDMQSRAEEEGDEQEQERLQEKQMEMMGEQLGMFKAQFRPMVWITLLTIPIFLWMWWQINSKGVGEATMIVPISGEIRFDSAIIGPLQAWIAWYFVCSMGFTQLLRKSLNVRPASG